MVSPRKIGTRLENLLAQEKRDTSLNIRLHFVPLDIATLETTLGEVVTDKLLVSEFLKKVTDYVTNRHANYIVLKGTLITQYYSSNLVAKTGIRSLTADTFKNRLPAVVYQNSKASSNILGVLYSSYGSVGENLFTAFLNKELTNYLKEYTDTEIRLGFDIGHVITTQSSLGTTPLREKILDVQEHVNYIISRTKGTNRAVLTNLQESLASNIQELESQSYYGNKITATFSKELTNTLLKVNALVVIPQDRRENQKIYGSNIEAKIQRAVAEELARVNFSRNIFEEIEYRLLDVFTKNKKPESLKANVSLDIAEKITKNKSVINVSAQKAPSARKPQLRTLQGRFSSLPTLKDLINSKLHDQIKANMGTGSSTSVLNYRTGRLANSAKVEKLSQSKQGLITAFYSYMQNPYATFSEGGRQQYPRSRDPKKLISKSIKEIAQQQVANRLRAVLV